MRVLSVGITATLFVKTVMVGSRFGVAPKLKEGVWMRLSRAAFELQRHHQNADQREEPKPSLRLP